MEEWNVSQWTRLTAAECMLTFSAGVWQQGFESQSRYIALRIWAGENTPVIRGAVWRLFHLSKSQEKSNPERRCRDIGFSFRRVRQALRMPLHRKYGSRKVARLFGRRRSSGVSDFPCLHGNERYGTCDDASTEIASIGLCQPQSRPHKTSGRNLLRGQPLNTPKKEK